MKILFKYISRISMLITIINSMPANASWHPLQTFATYATCIQYANQWTFEHHLTNPRIINAVCIFQAAGNSWLAFYQTVD